MLAGCGQGDGLELVGIVIEGRGKESLAGVLDVRHGSP